MILGYEWNSLLALACAAAGYLLGNIQTAIILSKRMFHDDVREHGSGNAGATNMLRVFGVKPGVITFVGDLCKGALSVLIGRLLMGELGGYLSALFVVIGHCYPVLAGFRGGKGVASSLGIAWMVFPLGAAITTLAAALLAVLTKRISVCSLSGFAVFFATVLIFRRAKTALVLLAGALLVIVYVRHKDNIVRLFRGEEKQILN